MQKKHTITKINIEVSHLKGQLSQAEASYAKLLIVNNDNLENIGRLKGQNELLVDKVKQFKIANSKLQENNSSRNDFTHCSYLDIKKPSEIALKPYDHHKNGTFSHSIRRMDYQ